jgi:hypothetical protein
VAIVYEVFEFKQGKSLKDISGPVTYIKVEDGQDKFAVLDKAGLPGNVYGYGLQVVEDAVAEAMDLANEIDRLECLIETLAECG